MLASIRELSYRVVLSTKTPYLVNVYPICPKARPVKADPSQNHPVARARVDRAQVGRAGADHRRIEPRRVYRHALGDRESRAIPARVLHHDLSARLHYRQRLVERPARLSRGPRVRVATGN